MWLHLNAAPSESSWLLSRTMSLRIAWSSIAQTHCKERFHPCKALIAAALLLSSLSGKRLSLPIDGCHLVQGAIDFQVDLYSTSAFQTLKFLHLARTALHQNIGIWTISLAMASIDLHQCSQSSFLARSWLLFTSGETFFWSLSKDFRFLKLLGQPQKAMIENQVIPHQVLITINRW